MIIWRNENYIYCQRQLLSFVVYFFIRLELKLAAPQSKLTQFPWYLMGRKNWEWKKNNKNNFARRKQIEWVSPFDLNVAWRLFFIRLDFVELEKFCFWYLKSYFWSGKCKFFFEWFIGVSLNWLLKEKEEEAV